MIRIPLVGASIIVEGTHVGTTTDADGAFRLPAAPGQRLTVSYLGYKSKTVTVGNRTSLDIILESDNSLINEVVVVGYDTQKKVNLTGSVASVSAEDLANRFVKNFAKFTGNEAGKKLVAAGPKVK